MVGHAMVFMESHILWLFHFLEVSIFGEQFSQNEYMHSYIGTGTSNVIFYDIGDIYTLDVYRFYWIQLYDSKLSSAQLDETIYVIFLCHTSMCRQNRLQNILLPIEQIPCAFMGRQRYRAIYTFMKIYYSYTAFNRYIIIKGVVFIYTQLMR